MYPEVCVPLVTGLWQNTRVLIPWGRSCLCPACTFWEPVFQYIRLESLWRQQRLLLWGFPLGPKGWAAWSTGTCCSHSSCVHERPRLGGTLPRAPGPTEGSPGRVPTRPPQYQRGWLSGAVKGTCSLKRSLMFFLSKFTSLQCECSDRLLQEDLHLHLPSVWRACVWGRPRAWSMGTSLHCCCLSPVTQSWENGTHFSFRIYTDFLWNFLRLCIMLIFMF